jgi:maleate isomerase
MGQRRLLGMLTPSSNTVLEPTCAAMLAGMADVSAHFARFRVTQIALSEVALRQFDEQPMLQAAELLADARVNAICWNGTSAGWLGLEADRTLCRAICERTGIGATTSLLALEEIFRNSSVKRYALVTPYLDDVQQAIIATFRREGFECVAERHLGLRDNFSFSEVAAPTVAEMVRGVAGSLPDAIAIVCTNLRAAQLVEELERQIGVPVYDTGATAVWGALRVAQVDPRRVQGWGRLFREQL